MTVIVTNAKSRIAYNIVKSLGQKGITVYTSDFTPLSMSFASKYSKGHFLYPSPFSKQKEFIECLIVHIKKFKAEVLIPVHEETYLIAKYKDILSKYVKLVIPDYQKILTMHNKNQWELIAKKLDIPVPKTFLVEDLQSSKKKRKELAFPLLIKPKQGGGGYGIRQINTLEELSILINRDIYMGMPWERYFIQEKIDGVVHCVAMLFCKGKYRAKSTYKQIRDYPVKGGQATLRMSIQNPKAEQYLERIMDELKWHGICQADFIVDKKVNIPYLIDINPRFWGSLAQGIASGVDFPYLLYKIAINGDIDIINKFNSHITTRWLGGDLRGFPKYYMRASNKKYFIIDFLNFRNNKITFDDFDILDPWPFFTWCLDAIIKILKQRTLKPTTHESLRGVWK